MSKLTLVAQGAAPATPSTGQASVFVDAATKRLASVNDVGVVTVYPASAAGEVNTGANAGAGAGVFRDKTGVQLNFRSLVAGASIAIAQLTDTITIALTALSATLNANNQNVTGLKLATFNGEFNIGSITGPVTIDWNNGQKQRITLTGNVTISFTDPPGPGNFLLRVIQDATGGRTATWPGSLKWPNGTAASVQSGGSNAIHVVSFYYDGTNYYGVGNLSFA